MALTAVARFYLGGAGIDIVLIVLCIVFVAWIIWTM